MAKITGETYTKTSRKKRPGVHSKKNTSNLKQSKNYKKLYKKQVK